LLGCRFGELPNIENGGIMKHVGALAFLAAIVFATQARADVGAETYCSKNTRIVGTGRGATFDIAKRAAIKMCFAMGGSGSCRNNVREVK
jgi:hypothetical protein